MVLVTTESPAGRGKGRENWEGNLPTPKGRDNGGTIPGPKRKILQLTLGPRRENNQRKRDFRQSIKPDGKNCSGGFQPQTGLP